MRVLGCLIEKQRTTPDAYPLTLNSLRLACNQSTNRDPVLDLDEGEIRAALERLGQRRWTRLASWSSGRSMKYRHMLGETLDLDERAGEPAGGADAARSADAGRAPAAHRSACTASARRSSDATLAALEERELVRLLPRRPGQREQRYEQLLGGVAEAPPDAEPAEPPVADAAPPPADAGGLDARVERVESELAALRDELRALREELGA